MLPGVMRLWILYLFIMLQNCIHVQDKEGLLACMKTGVKLEV
jgi:hypothetical protein